MVFRYHVIVAALLVTSAYGMNEEKNKNNVETTSASNPLKQSQVLSENDQQDQEEEIISQEETENALVTKSFSDNQRKYLENLEKKFVIKYEELKNYLTSKKETVPNTPQDVPQTGLVQTKENKIKHIADNIITHIKNEFKPKEHSVIAILLSDDFKPASKEETAVVQVLKGLNNLKVEKGVLNKQALDDWYKSHLQTQPHTMTKKEKAWAYYGYFAKITLPMLAAVYLFGHLLTRKK